MSDLEDKPLFAVANQFETESGQTLHRFWLANSRQDEWDRPV
jgi:hypothetical protein